jgi:hypothetical protein
MERQASKDVATAIGVDDVRIPPAKAWNLGARLLSQPINRDSSE